MRGVDRVTTLPACMLGAVAGTPASAPLARPPHSCALVLVCCCNAQPSIPATYRCAPASPGTAAGSRERANTAVSTTAAASSSSRPAGGCSRPDRPLISASLAGAGGQAPLAGGCSHADGGACAALLLPWQQQGGRHYLLAAPAPTIERATWMHASRPAGIGGWRSGSLAVRCSRELKPCCPGQMCLPRRRECSGSALTVLSPAPVGLC